MNEQINKYLTEAMGECWHEWKYPHYQLQLHDFHNVYVGMGNICTCGFMRLNRVNWNVGNDLHLGPKCVNNDFFTWTGFGKLWEWAQKQEWWWQFRDYMEYKHGSVYPDFINPTLFATAIYNFLKEREK